MTLTAKAEVINAAAAHLGEPGFTAIDTDPPGAKLAKFLAQLDGRAGVERWALSRHPWLCALSFASLSPSGSIAANWQWDKAFELPASCVKLHLVDGEDIPYQAGTWVNPSTQAVKQIIWSNEATLDVAYTETRPFEAYSADLCNVMALMLASRTAGPLKADHEGALRLKKAAEEALSIAQGGEAGQIVEPETLFRAGFARLRAAAAF